MEGFVADFAERVGIKNYGKTTAAPAIERKYVGESKQELYSSVQNLVIPVSRTGMKE